MTGSVSSENDIDLDVDGIELEAIPESPKSSRPDPSDWDRDSLADLEALSEMSQPDVPSAATPAALDMQSSCVAACIRQPPAVYEAHTVISNRPAEAAAVALNTGAKMRQRKMGVAMAPDNVPLIDCSRFDPAGASSAPPSAHQISGPPSSSVKQSSLRVGEDVVCHR